MFIKNIFQNRIGWVALIPILTAFIVGHYGSFDGTYYLSEMERVPRHVAIVRVNRYLIAYAWHPASNARELVEYAISRKNIELLCL